MLNNPLETFYDVERKNFKSYAKIHHPVHIEESYLLVIYEKRHNNIKVRTAMWRTMGGLRASGFSKI